MVPAFAKKCEYLMKIIEFIFSKCEYSRQVVRIPNKNFLFTTEINKRNGNLFDISYVNTVSYH